jgi:hypothetical protein
MHTRPGWGPAESLARKLLRIDQFRRKLRRLPARLGLDVSAPCVSPPRWWCSAKTRKGMHDVRSQNAAAAQIAVEDVRGVEIVAISRIWNIELSSHT